MIDFVLVSMKSGKGIVRSHAIMHVVIDVCVIGSHRAVLPTCTQFHFSGFFVSYPIFIVVML